MSPAPQDTAAETLALTIVRRLQDNGYRAYYVGGAVRDMLLGRRASDYDVATDAPLSEIRRLFPIGLWRRWLNEALVIKCRAEVSFF